MRGPLGGTWHTCPRVPPHWPVLNAATGVRNG